MKPRAPTAFYGDELWAITSYFNPASYRRRLANFNTFRQHLPIPLVAVELAYDADFELQEADAEILIQLRGGALLWQKECLLNVALQALPAACRKVAWLDCDVVFGKPGWCEAASSLLDRVPIIQLVREAHYPPRHSARRRLPVLAFRNTTGGAPGRRAWLGQRVARFWTSMVSSIPALSVAVTMPLSARPTIPSTD